jgi:threonine dehydratase
MIDHHHKIIEGSAGVALSAFLHHPERFEGQAVVIVICGANIATEKLRKIL